MIFNHHNLKIELPDSWIEEAGVNDFVPEQDAYPTAPYLAPDQNIFIVSFDSVEPLVSRARNLGIFCDSKDTGETAKERVLRILQMIKSKEPIEPVKVVESHDIKYKFKLVEGSHRFHCALVVGYRAIPATKGFEL